MTTSRHSSETPTIIHDQHDTIKQDAIPYPASSPSGSPTVREEDDEVLIVNWEGSDDPENPRNWAYSRKWSATVIVSLFTFISPLSSSMIAPAAAQMAGDLHIEGNFGTALAVSIFVLAYAIGPLIFGPLSELYGRSRVLQLANMFFLAWNVGCGFATSEGQIYAFRFLSGIGGSAPLAIGGAVIGDLFDPEHRGQAVALYSLAPLLGPVIGPVAGGWIAEKSTWRWVFWSASIADGMIQCFGIYFLAETYPPVLLHRRADILRKAMDTEKGKKQYREIRTPFEVQERHWKRLMARTLGRPFKLFALEPILQLFGTYIAFIYGLIYLVLTTVPEIFQSSYGHSPGIAGLHYIALGIGISGASQVNARALDRIYHHFTVKNGGIGRPEFRLPSMVPGSLMLPAGLVIFGWSAQYKVFWIVPDIGLALIGAGIILNFQSIQSYVIDAFALHAASALAAVTCFRSLAGFGFPLFAPAMYSALGYGKGNTILAAFAIVVGIPAPWLFWRYGKRIRELSRHAIKDKEGGEKGSQNNVT